MAPTINLGNMVINNGKPQGGSGGTVSSIQQHGYVSVFNAKAQKRNAFASEWSGKAGLKLESIKAAGASYSSGSAVGSFGVSSQIDLLGGPEETLG